MKKEVSVCIAVSVAAILFAGCATTRQDWERARATDTVSAYEEFLAKNPQNEFSDSAQRRIAELQDLSDWRNTEARGTAPAYEDYLKKRPNGRYTTEARQAMADFQRFAPKATADQGLAAQGKGAIKVVLDDVSTDVFIVPCAKGLTLENDDRVALRDTLLRARARIDSRPIGRTLPV